MKAHELLNSPEKWCQESLAKDECNVPVAYGSDAAVKWCVVGALWRCYTISEYIAVMTKVREYFQSQLNMKPELYMNDLYRWNDDPARSYEDVIKMFKDLDI